MVHNKRFAPYDLGKDINMKLYGAVSHPPIPIYLFILSFRELGF